MTTAAATAARSTRREDNYIRTYTGGRFWPLDPHVDDVKLDDIAHALSHVCRFTGHTREFYCVAQHSVIVAEHLERTEPDAAFHGLLHDGSEAYLLDLARPVKHDPEMEIYRVVEKRLQSTIYRAFGLTEVEPPAVKTVDAWVLHAELRDLINGAHPGHAQRAGEHPVIKPWTSALAKMRFLETFVRLDRRRRGEP
jgi:hypothetical protein